MSLCGACIRGEPCIGVVLYPEGFPEHGSEKPLIGMCEGATDMRLAVLVRVHERPDVAELVEALRKVPGVIDAHARGS